ncbi:MAG: site-specific integrase [Chloroflexi bacterium]|nr:site-specific integrase [Chloroflexota bacterium]
MDKSNSNSRVKRLAKTSAPGIYQRPGGSYTFAVRINGRQEWQSYPTFDQARRAKQSTSTARDNGEYVKQSRLGLLEYIDEWLPRYRGNGRRGFREETRHEYDLIITKHYKKYPPFKTVKLTALDAAMVDRFVHHLSKQPGRRTGTTLSDQSVRNLLNPLRAAMASARREGLIKHNPVIGVALPHTAQIEEDHDRAMPFPNGTMEMVIQLVHTKHRLMFEVLGVTGLRRSELLALCGRHLKLDGERPVIQVRQRVRRMKGKGLVIGPLKSKYSRRDVPIPIAVADKLQALHIGSNDLVFANAQGKLLDANNLTNRVLAPAISEAGAIGGWHTFRHTVASRLFADGRNVVQVQHWLGHLQHRLRWTRMFIC